MAELAKRLAAEGIGTFALVTVGTGAVYLNDTGSALGNGGIALAFGLIVWLMVALFGSVSGAHINPAVTVGFRLTGAISTRLAALYVLVQFSAAAAASGLLRAWAGAGAELGVTRPSTGVAQAFMLEILITAVLMWVILVIVNRPVRNSWLAGVGIGSWVALAAWAAGPLTGASMNPARSFGPAVAAQDFHLLWLYLLAPLLGASVGMAFCRISHSSEHCCRSRLPSA